MSLNFNVDPYYDDFDQTKNFHRILFKPGVAVQARELTQAQTILQDQITKFADNIFKQNSPVTGGQVTTNFNCYYIKLQTTFNNSLIDVTQFNGKLVQNATGTILARVIAVAAPSGSGTIGDPPTLVVSYQTGQQFTDNDIIYDTASNLAAQALSDSATGSSSTASIAQGVFYVLGNFVQISPSTVILDKYNNSPNLRVGLTITETVVDYVNDPSLLDPAVGASNYQAPGADRYYISLTLSTRNLQLGDDQNFIELVRIVDGDVQKMVDGSVYNVIDDYFAKRDYETNGDYVVNDFKLTPKTNEDSSKYTLSVGKGLAYVHGYRIESQTPIDIVSNRARTTATQNNNPIYIDSGSYFYVDSVAGANGSFFDITTTQQVDLHCVQTSNIVTTNTSTYNSTVVGTGYIRGLVYDHAEGADSNTASYVYRAYVTDIQNSVLTANAVSATSNTITFPSTYSATSNAYLGVNLSIVEGPSAGDFRTITSYNGTTRTATVNQNWTATPTTSSKFNINFDIKDIETIAAANKTSWPASIRGKANIDIGSKVNNLSSGDTYINNPSYPELLYRVGSTYVADLYDTSFTTQQVWRSVTFTSIGSAVTAQINYEGNYEGIIKNFGTPSSTLSADLIKQNYTIIVTDKGTNTTINVGDVIPWTTAGRSVTLDNDSSIATFTSTDLQSFTATIVAKIYVVQGDNTAHILKYKNLITANTTTVNTNGTQVNGNTYVDDAADTSTGQVYIHHAGLVTPGQAQSLYLSDVKSIVKIIDTKAIGTAPTVAMLTNPSYDVTSNYIFDNGQRDSHYDHATITLKPGAPQPAGNLLVLLNYYQHSGGDGYFSLISYIESSRPEQYQQIPYYTAKSGINYSLRDSLDFRPARKNAQTSYVYRYANEGDTVKYGVFLPVDTTTFVGDYTYYLGRIDKLILSKDRSFQIVEGSPSLAPIAPAEPDGSLVIATLTHTPYTGYIPTEAPTGVVPDLSIQKVKHKRYTMQDIAGLESRINNVEYYASLNMLEQKAQSLQISDAYGLNRFKNGILVDDFSSYSAADTLNTDYLATINRRERVMTASQDVQNFPLKGLATVYNMGMLSPAASSSLGYAINNDGYVNYYTLPYTTSNTITQKLASRTVNVNPFSFSLTQGVINLSPNVDNWVDTDYAPSLLITDPSLQVFQANNSAVNVLTVGDWQAISGTSYSTTSGPVEGHGVHWSPFGNVGYVQTTTYTTTNLQQNNLLGPYDNIGNTYSLNNGYITDISVLPYIRPQQIVVRENGMLFNSNVNAYFDNTNINGYLRKTNVIELQNVVGTGFQQDDVIGYYTAGVFHPTGRVVGVHTYPNSNNIRLYVAADGTSTTYTTNGKIQNAFFNTSGIYQSNTANATVISTSHVGGQIANANSSTVIQLSKLASTANSHYVGNTIYINTGSSAGQSATITSYYGANQVAVLSSTLSVANGDTYSIGSMNTDEAGAFYGIFNVPSNTFHTGQRVLRIDNGYAGAANSATTYAEGTFYAEGLHVVSQGLDFGASPAGARGVFTQSNYANTTSVAVTYSPWDPVAQTFILSKDNYPNGLFLDSITIFFASKPTVDNTPITLSIVGTQNGYPNGTTLDHSIVTLTPAQVKTSTAPQYLDSTAGTKFQFKVPVYIQAGTMYAFILKSNSNQYTMWTASNGDTALASSVRNLPTDPVPSTITKIGSAPYVGALFVSQNAQTWTADQNQSLMFVADRCVFNKNVNPTIQYVVPNKLPQRTLVDQSVNYYLDANSVATDIISTAQTDVLVDAFNVTTTDFTPTSTAANYSYNATLVNGTAAGNQNIIPGKFGTATQSNIYLTDGKGERVLVANSNTSFSLYSSLATTDDAVSPIISDAGLSVYAIKWNINNCELSNSNITLTNGGSGYNVACTSVTVSAPTGAGAQQAYASANIVGGIVQSVYITNPGSGYITTPTITISDANSAPGTGASVVVTGETSPNGGNASAKYVTKKVVLNAGFDSGDLNVYLSAYRPVNTDINVYYKILNRNDTQTFESGTWQLMTKINNSGAIYSKTRNDVAEFVFAPGTGGTEQGYVSYTSTNGQTYNTFSQFAIKIVLTSSDKTYVPYVTDLRAIALPPNTNTTF